MTLDWQPVDDDDHAQFVGELLAFQISLENYEPPDPDRPRPSGDDLEYLRWRAALHERDHPELKWRIWNHPQNDEMLWMQIGATRSAVDARDARTAMNAADNALRSFKDYHAHGRAFGGW